MDLFRHEVVAELKSKNVGEVILLRRPSSIFYTCLFVALVAAIVVFFCVFNVSRHASFAGVVVPEFGFAQVRPAGAGTITQRLVNDGQHVNAGDALFVLSSTTGHAGAVPKVSGGQQGSRSAAQSTTVDLETVRAPCAGMVTQAVPLGLHAAASQTLAAIAPDGAALMAELTPRSKTGATFRPGDQVVIRYADFPFQKYGNYGGVVASVVSADTGAHHAGTASGLRVRLTENVIRARGRLIPITAGMQLEATIMWERRKLYQWILDPIDAEKSDRT